LFWMVTEKVAFVKGGMGRVGGVDGWVCGGAKEWRRKVAPTKASSRTGASSRRGCVELDRCVEPGGCVEPDRCVEPDECVEMALKVAT
jgi:hypothetical protein